MLSFEIIRTNRDKEIIMFDTENFMLGKLLKEHTDGLIEIAIGKK